MKKADGSEYVGVVWTGAPALPISRAPRRARVGADCTRSPLQNGVSGFWNDMNQPAVFDGPGKTMPLDNIHRIEEPGFATRTATHSEIHNVVGLEYARALYDESLLELRPDERPFVLTRATFAGGQRYGFTWTGYSLYRATMFAWRRSNFLIWVSMVFLLLAMRLVDLMPRRRLIC